MMNIFAEIKKPGYRPGQIINILKKGDGGVRIGLSVADKSRTN
jgi:hypothetical protein